MDIHKVCWLLEEDVFEETDSLEAEIRSQGMAVKKIVPEAYCHSDAFRNLFDARACVVFHGSLRMARRIQRDCGWIPGVWYTGNRYDCTHYYPRLAPFLLNHNYIMLPYGDLKRRGQELRRLFTEPARSTMVTPDLLNSTMLVERLFVRPNSGGKMFTGLVIGFHEWEEETEKLRLCGIQPHDLCVVAPARRIYREWRFVVSGEQVLTCSHYADTTPPEQAPPAPPAYLMSPTCDQFRNAPWGALHLADQVTRAGYIPDAAWSFDICQTDAGYKLVEINSASCAGWYSCHLKTIVQEFSLLALNEWKTYRE